MLITAFCKVVMHLFFSTVQVHNPDRMPKRGPVLVVSNHHSSLMDPVALLATLPRRPRFLAKSALWEAKYLPLRPFLLLAATIPVHRHVDGGGDNTGMFAACQDALARGEVIALFGEGVSHNLPGLLDVKTGAARIALGTDAAVAVVPVGLIYDDRAKFRSRAMAYVGEPIEVVGAAGGEEDRERVRAVTAAIAAGLDDVAPSWESWEAHHSARVAARLVAADSPAVEVGAALTAINREVDAETDVGRAVLAAVDDLETESARLGLDIETVVEQPRDKVGLLNTLSFLKTALWFLPTILGRVVNLPPFALIGRLAATQDLNFQASAKVLLGVFLYPGWWLALGVVGWLLIHPAIGLAALACAPTLGYVSSRKYGRIRRLRNRNEVRTKTADGDARSDLEQKRSVVLVAAADALRAHPT